MGDPWEKVARLLATNTKCDLDELTEVIQKIGRNIVDDPGEMKFRRLKASNKTIKVKILEKNGGMELLTCLGFVARVDEAGERYLELLPQKEDSTGGEPTIFSVDDSLQANLSWLQTTAETISQQAVHDGSPCAEFILQIRLPTGTKVIGGFLKDETIMAVVSFVKTFFSEDRRVVLRQPHDASDLANRFNGDGSHPTLEKLGIGKKAMLLCTTLGDDAREELITEKRNMMTDALESDQIKLKSTVRSSVVAARSKKVMLASERESLTRQFEEDRKNFRKED